MELAKTFFLKDAHILDADAVCNYYNVTLDKGLTDSQVTASRKKYGSNELAHQESKNIWLLFYEQFQDLLARILLAAALVSFALALLSGEGISGFVEPLVILLILAANAVVSIWQESNAEKSLEALKKLQPELAHVLRNSTWLTLPAKDLVPGDICEVRVGVKVPADMRLVKLKTIALRAEQSELTGEAHSVLKDEKKLDISYEKCEIQAKSNMLFSSTTIANGCGLAIVTAIGMETVIGEVQSAVKTAGEKEDQTPLQIKLDEFAELLSKVIGIICVLVWLINFRNFEEPSHGGYLRGCIYYFKTAIALAVAAIPEGLTAVITTCLALGTKKMAQKNAIVRRLPSVETLGCTTVICSDKTGTLTTNQMSCIRFSLPNSSESLDVYDVEGYTYDPIGKINLIGSTKINHKILTTDVNQRLDYIKKENICMQEFAKCAVLCNDSRLTVNSNGITQRQGEPTEAALKVLIEKLGCFDNEINKKYLQVKLRNEDEPFGDFWKNGITKLATLEFTRDRKSMSVLCYDDNKESTIQYIKGAPESILSRCDTVILPDGTIQPLSFTLLAQIQDEIDRMASSALRILALAIKYDTGELKNFSNEDDPCHAKLVNPENFSSFENNMTFCGLVGMVDPPRPEVKDAIKICKQAGIKVIMITGDNKKTAEAVAVKIGIINTTDIDKLSLTGREFEDLPESDKIRILGYPRGAVFSRTEPRHKQMIIQILHELGEITAMTGDGVNDAPALKQADIGIAMGISGTEVAKEASDMILADDNFMTIVQAVEEGRSIYNNMKAFIRYLISSNIGEVASIFLTAALGIPEGLAPVQLLWVNLVTDGFPATALGFNPADVDVMKKGPRKKDDNLISGWVFFRYMVIGLYVGLATVGIFIWWFTYGVDPRDGHTLVPFWQISNWTKCHEWQGFKVNTIYDMDLNDSCTYFTQGKIKASTLSLTVLVVIEMLNSLNALSEDGSLFIIPPWRNPWLLLAIFGSILVHCAILYIPLFAGIFNVVPLSLHDWLWVLAWSSPVLLIDEILKYYARSSNKAKNIKSHNKPKKIQ